MRACPKCGFTTTGAQRRKLELIRGLKRNVVCNELYQATWIRKLISTSTVRRVHPSFSTLLRLTQRRGEKYMLGMITGSSVWNNMQEKSTAVGGPPASLSGTQFHSDRHAAVTEIGKDYSLKINVVNMNYVEQLEAKRLEIKFIVLLLRVVFILPFLLYSLPETP